MNDLIAYEKIEPPEIPEEWDCGKSIEKVKANRYKAKFLTDETMGELWVAHSKLAKRGGDRKSDNIKSKNLALISWDDYCQEIGITTQTVQNWFVRYGWILDKPHVSHNSGDNEWYTPTEYVEAARETLGTIDLDPASSEEANAVVKAKKYFTEDDDGLSKKWKGKVYMNPPYAQPLVRLFCEKIAEHWLSGDITEAIVLVNNATETDWWQGIGKHASAICFPDGRVKFWHPRKESIPLQGQTVLYIGKNTKSFMQSFKGFGVCRVLSEI